MEKEYLESNKSYWNERVEIHKQSELYSVDDFKKGQNKLNPLEREELGDITGKSILHLQCHFGMDTLSLKMLGASDVTGIDFSEEAIRSAKELSIEKGIEAEFIETNIYDLKDKINRKFDIVFTSYGTIFWLPDIKKWGEIAAHFVKPGGFLYIVDVHPTSSIFDNDTKGIDSLKVRYPYFHRDEPLEFNEPGSYADKNADTKNNRTFEWSHSMSDIVMSMIDNGLTIEFLHEHPFTGWDQFPFMIIDENGYRRIEGDPIPLLFSIKARKKA